jgi:hypothetical protein
MLPTKFWFIWPSGLRGEDFFKLVKPQAIFFSDWSISKKSIPQQPHGQMN